MTLFLGMRPLHVIFMLFTEYAQFLYHSRVTPELSLIMNL